MEPQYLHYRNLTVSIKIGAMQGLAPAYGVAVPLTCHCDDFQVNFPATTLDQAGRCSDLHREIVVVEKPRLTMTLRIPSTGLAASVQNGRQVEVVADPGDGVAATAYRGIVVDRGHASPMGQFQTQTITVSISSYADVA